MKPKSKYSLQCPIPKSDYAHVMLAHAGGGRLTKHLIDRMFYPLLDNAFLHQGHDGAMLPPIEGEIAMSTDSFVVDPIFFPGGDIGELAVNGTVNDLICCGAEPLYISLAFILEEGFLLDELWKVVQSIAISAKAAGMPVTLRIANPVTTESKQALAKGRRNASPASQKREPPRCRP